MPLPFDPANYARLKTKGKVSVAKAADFASSGLYAFAQQRFDPDDGSAVAGMTAGATLAELQALLAEATQRRNALQTIIADVQALG